MENIHRLTKITMDLVGQTVRDFPTVPTVEEMKLRLALELEELREKAEAMGLEGTFGLMMWHGANKVLEDTKAPEPHVPHNISDIFAQKDTGVVNLVEVFDAALDQRVVASGTDLCFGFQHIIEEGDKAVWTSNMSKFDRNIEDAFSGIEAYKKGTHPHGKGTVDAYVHSKDGYHIIKRSDNHKYLKSLNYSAVDLRPLIELEVELNIKEDGKQS